MLTALRGKSENTCMHAGGCGHMIPDTHDSGYTSLPNLFGHVKVYEWLRLIPISWSIIMVGVNRTLNECATTTFVIKYWVKFN